MNSKKENQILFSLGLAAAFGSNIFLVFNSQISGFDDSESYLYRYFPVFSFIFLAFIFDILGFRKTYFTAFIILCISFLYYNFHQFDTINFSFKNLLKIPSTAFSVVFFYVFIYKLNPLKINQNLILFIIIYFVLQSGISFIIQYFIRQETILIGTIALLLIFGFVIQLFFSSFEVEKDKPNLDPYESYNHFSSKIIDGFKEVKNGLSRKEVYLFVSIYVVYLFHNFLNNQIESNYSSDFKNYSSFFIFGTIISYLLLFLIVYYDIKFNFLIASFAILLINDLLLFFKLDNNTTEIYLDMSNHTIRIFLQIYFVFQILKIAPSQIFLTTWLIVILNIDIIINLLPLEAIIDTNSNEIFWFIYGTSILLLVLSWYYHTILKTITKNPNLITNEENNSVDSLDFLDAYLHGK